MVEETCILLRKVNLINKATLLLTGAPRVPADSISKVNYPRPFPPLSPVLEHGLPSRDDARKILPPRQADIEPQPEREEVRELDDAERADPHAEAEEAADVGEEVDDPEELGPLLPHEVQRLEVDVHHGQVVGHVRVVAVVGSICWGKKVNTYRAAT